MKTTVTIDPRLHDAIIFDLDGVVADSSINAPNDVVQKVDSIVALVRKLAEAGVATAVYSSGRNCEQVLNAAGLDDLFAVRVDGVVADALALPGQPDPAVLLTAINRLGTTPERTVVVEGAQDGVQAGHDGGFALVIGVDRQGHANELLHSGADVVVEDLAQVAVRQGDRRISELPNALDSYGQLIGVVAGRQPFVCLDFDGTLSEIVAEPDAARLVPGAAKALERLAALWPVAILSGRDLADVRDRVGIPGIWYSGSHGFELVGPDGSHHHNDAADAAVPLLESAAADLREDLGHVPGSERRAQALRRRGPLSQRRTGTGGRGRRDNAPTRTAAWTARDGRPQARRTATRHRLGQGRRAGLARRPDPSNGSRAAHLRRRRSH